MQPNSGPRTTPQRGNSVLSKVVLALLVAILAACCDTSCLRTPDRGQRGGGEGASRQAFPDAVGSCQSAATAGQPSPIKDSVSPTKHSAKTIAITEAFPTRPA